MPSPLAHPAAAVPFARTGLILSALVVGSLAPDFGYLLPLSNTYFMNTAAGVILFDVPVGFVLLWLFHTFAKWPLLSIVPDGLQRRLYGPAQGFSFGSFKRFWLIVLSLLVGSVTHVVWDSFTHEWGWTVEHFALLRSSLGGTPLFVILQSLGSILGVGLLAYWVVRWMSSAPQSDRLPPRFSSRVRTIFLVAVVLSLIAAEGLTASGLFVIGTHLLHEHGLVHGLTLEAILILSFYGVMYWLAWIIALRGIHRASPWQAGHPEP